MSARAIALDGDLRAVVIAGLLLSIAGPAAGQPERLGNGPVTVQPLAGPLDRTLDRLRTASVEAQWVGYEVPAPPGDRWMCDSNEWTRRQPPATTARLEPADLGLRLLSRRGRAPRPGTGLLARVRHRRRRPPGHLAHRGAAGRERADAGGTGPIARAPAGGRRAVGTGAARRRRSARRHHRPGPERRRPRTPAARRCSGWRSGLAPRRSGPSTTRWPAIPTPT